MNRLAKIVQRSPKTLNGLGMRYNSTTRVTNQASKGGLGGMFRNLWKKDEPKQTEQQEKEQEQKQESENENEIVAEAEGGSGEQQDFSSVIYNNEKSVIMDHPKFLPVEQVESQLKPILEELVTLDTKEWKTTDISEFSTKEKVMVETIKALKIQISNVAINNIRTVSDLVNVLSTDPSTTGSTARKGAFDHPVAKFYTSLQKENTVDAENEQLKQQQQQQEQQEQQSVKLPSNMKFVPFKKGERKLHARC